MKKSLRWWMKKTLRKGYYWKGKKVDIKPQDVEEKGKKKERT